ncbi:hypothetical protein pb186bvf_009948 [Paramecium bursaria]
MIQLQQGHELSTINTPIYSQQQQQCKIILNEIKISLQGEYREEYIIYEQRLSLSILIIYINQMAFQLSDNQRYKLFDQQFVLKF